MKVFFPLGVFFPSQSGGVSNAAYWLTKNLAKEGFEPIVIASNEGLMPEVPLNRWRENEAGRVIYVRTRSLNFPVGHTLYSLRHFNNAEIVHLSSLFFPAAFITAIAARLFRKKIMWSVHGELDPPALKLSSGRKRPILLTIKWLMGNYPLFHSTCDEETQYIHDVFGADARVLQIPNYMEIPGQAERSAGNYLLYIGRLHVKKGIENLITALSMNAEFIRSGTVLKIAGKGKPRYESELRELVSKLNLNDKIDFVGQVEGVQKEQLLADALWTIMPSHTENFGLVVIESLAQGTPVIASKGTPWKVLDDERVGFWIENSPEALSEILTKVMTMSREEYEGYRQRGRPFVEQNFDMEKNIGRWVEAYRSMI